MSTRNPAEDIITSVGNFLSAKWNSGVAAFNADTGDGVNVANVTWGNGYSDLLNAQKLPAGDVYLGNIRYDAEEDTAVGVVDVGVRFGTNTQSDMKKQVSRYADYLYQLIEDYPELDNRVVLAEMTETDFGVSAQARETAIVLATVEVTVERR